MKKAYENYNPLKTFEHPKSDNFFSLHQSCKIFFQTDKALSILVKIGLCKVSYGLS